VFVVERWRAVGGVEDAAHRLVGGPGGVHAFGDGRRLPRTTGSSRRLEARERRAGRPGRAPGDQDDVTGELVARLAGLHRGPPDRSEEHTSELQSRENLVFRLLLEK